MEWLNYHHLYYFWVIAHQGSIARACEILHLTQPTLSAQLKVLEDRLGTPLFERRQRKLLLTDTGRTVLSYADRIFRLGQELLDTVAERPSGGPRLLQLGVVDAVPKPLSFQLVSRVLDDEPLVRITVHEGRLETLLQSLHMRALDLILSDVSAPTDAARPVRSHRLALMPVGLVCTPAWRQLRREFPGSLNEAPMALPTMDSPLRHAVDTWLSAQSVTPRVLAECQDAELLKRFAVSGIGLAPVNLSAVKHELEGGELIQLGPELAEEQLWIVSSVQNPLSALASWIWSELEKGRLLSLEKHGTLELESEE